VSREPLCASCVDFLVAYRPLWLDPALLPGPSLLDLLAPHEVALLSTEGGSIEWRSTAHDPSSDDAVRLIGLLGLEADVHPVVSVGDSEVLHAFLAEARRSPPEDSVHRSALAALYRYLASRDWVPPHLAEEYRLRAKTLQPAAAAEPAAPPTAVSRAEAAASPEAEELPPPVPEEIPPAVPEEIPVEPVATAEPAEAPAEAPVEEAAESESPLPGPGPGPEPGPEPEPPLPLPEPEPQPTPEPEPEPEPEEPGGEPAATPPTPPEPSQVMATLSAELREMKEELQGEIAKERESVQAWIRERAGAMESKEKDLQLKEQVLEAEAKAVEAAQASVTQRLQAVEKDEARLAVLRFLDTVPGITEDVAHTLVTVFPDMASLRSADAKALTQCQGVTEVLAKAIRFELVPGEVEDEQRAIDLREEAQAFLEEGDYRAALQCYDRLITEHPEDKVFWFDKAELHVLLDEPEEALQCYTRVLDLDRRDRQAWFERANLLFGMGRLADAVDALREAIRAEPRRSGDILLKAEQLRRDGHANEAAILYQALLDVDPGNGRAVLGLGDTFLALGDHDAAEGLFSRALGKEGKDPELLFRKGELLNRKGRWGAAIQFYNRALALKWDLSPAWLAKGHTLLLHDRAPEALECFEKVLSLDPENEEARAGKREAEALVRSVRTPPAPSPAAPPRETTADEAAAPEASAEEEIDELLESVEPSFADALREAVGEEKEEPKPVDQVPPDFKSFVESVEPENEDTHVLIQLAELALEGGDADMALLRYEQALAQDPKSAKAWTGKGTALQQLERYEAALAAYDRALELDPDDAIAKRWRETCLRHLRRSGTP
jgi:tetratricopeptide (TPR) repeat protein